MQFPRTGLDEADAIIETRGNRHAPGGRNVGYFIKVGVGAFRSCLRAVSSVAWVFIAWNRWRFKKPSDLGIRRRSVSPIEAYGKRQDRDCSTEDAGPGQP
jgi:hypothetical protein